MGLKLQWRGRRLHREKWWGLGMRLQKKDLFIYTRTYSRHCGVDARQHQGKRSENSGEKERDRGREGKTAYPISGNWCASRGGRIE